MNIIDPETWAKTHAGHKVKVNYLGKRIGTVVGYQANTGRILIKGPGNWQGSDPNTTYYVDCDLSKGEYGWFYGDQILELVEDDISISFTIPGKKIIDDYPHRCPKCQGPAYVGFAIIDCKGKCS